MNDLYQYFDSDLTTSSTGDLLPVDGTLRGQQRVLRRLLTNPGDYIFHTDYGAGLPSYVGSVANIAQVKSVIRSQMLLEDAVAQSPAPIVNVRAIQNGLSVSIKYVDSVTKQPVSLNFNVNK